MATDSSLEETDAPPDDAREETGTRGTPSPPRPPRPGKRSKGSGRIPIPLPQSRPDFEAVDGDSLDRAPAIDIDERGEPAAPPVFPSVSSLELASLPEESFADIDADLADRAPPAPVTPRRNVSARVAISSEATPARGTPIRFDTDDEERVSEPEPTIVGKVSENLLELSGAGSDENTRAFTAPRELIELARRKREERLHGISSDELVRTTRPPRDAGAVVELKVPAAPHVPAESVAPSEEELDAAPAVARSEASELGRLSRPPDRAHTAAPDSGPEIEIDPASELSPSARRAVLASTGRNEPLSLDAEGVRKPPKRGWLFLFGLFVVLGIIIARWRELAALFR